MGRHKSGASIETDPIMKHGYDLGLESPRLRTRLLMRADAEHWVPFLEDDETLRFIPFGPDEPTDSLSRAVEWMDRNLQRYREGKFGFHALIDKASGRLVGQCGLITRQIEGRDEIEVAYHILPAYRGLGYAAEASRSFRDFAFYKGITESLISLIAIDNIGSQKVAAKNHFRPGHTVNWDGLEVIVYRITAEEWQSLR